ncbi:uncharacterized protein LOC106459993 [Limulus polyphemus]|uniref:Uncharacterized protein LOC106459993 n=1 Tax=Limulus polyphemus TaxID=6850 RepID=A0ABM1B5C4_LIMPO|nr:uncharacterized protein LOC106459993 [Limulus polyphemus]
MRHICVFFVVLSFGKVCKTVQFSDEVSNGSERNRYRRQVEEVLSSRLQEFLGRTRENEDGTFNPSLIIQKFINDPLQIPNFNISSDTMFFTVNGQLWDMKLHGLKELVVKRGRMNLATMEASVEMFVQSLKLEGEYMLDGSVTFFSIDGGGGGFWMKISDIAAFGRAKLKIVAGNQSLEVDSVHIDIEVSDIQLHFENLFGGSAWSSISNSLLNQLSGMIFDQAKQSILEEIRESLREELNTQLHHIPEGFINSGSTTIFDDTLRRVSMHLKQNNMDPFSLPDHKEVFQKKLLFFLLHGEARIFNGILSGLSTLHRTGDVLITYENNAVIVEVNIGFSNLTGDYNWSAKLMGIGPNGHASLSIRSISVYLRVRQELQTGSKPVIKAFKIANIRHLWVDVQGLGTMDLVLQIIVNLITNSLKMTIADAITGPVQKAVQQELNSLPIEII